MIRREIQLPDQPKQWLLISQIEHARLCGVLAESCLTSVDQSLHRELLQAAVHHDDGWSTWDARPKVDPDEGRPYSFRELPVADSLSIWKHSIDAAARYGLLSGWLVARHFLALLEKSESIKDAVVSAWRDEVEAWCSKRLAAWQKTDPARNTVALAGEGLAWLQLFDMMSLWLCSVCSGLEESAATDRESYLFADSHEQLLTWCHFRRGQASFEPWPFGRSAIDVSAHGWLVPIRSYDSSLSLADIGVAHDTRWHIVQES
ncbi:MAG: DUF3891 family protein [Planctomycetota bacterium]